MAKAAAQQLTHFLSCDWGTSTFRLRLIELPSLATAAQCQSNDGIGRLPTGAGEDAFADFLADRIASLQADSPVPLAGLPVVLSGMASSSIGWRELPYAPTPFPLDGSALEWARLDTVAGNPAYLLSGVRTASDVMRGEETELLGLFAKPELRDCSRDALVIMPGTHSKHIRVRQGAVVDIHTYLTSELYAVLAQHSILRHSVTANAATGFPADPFASDATTAAFLDGLAQARREPLARSLFRVRTNDLLAGMSPAVDGASLHGLLLGGELADLPQQLEETTPVLLAAGVNTEPQYRRTLEEFGLGGQLRAIPDDGIATAVRGQALFVQQHVALGP